MTDTLFSGATPTKYLWVSAGAAAGGDGSAGKPFATINAAIAKAAPGTAIMVKGGTYTENVVIPRTINGTETAPIWLVSADGPQQAHIVAATNDKPAIGGGGVENIVVKDFWVTGGKNGIQFSQNGTDYTDMIKNIVVSGNLIEGAVQDGIKVNGGANVQAVGNTVKGGGDQGIDFFAIIGGKIDGNSVSDITGDTGIFAKGGSVDIAITGNRVSGVKGDGIAIGGWSNPTLFRAGYDSFEAKNVTVTGNVVENVTKRALNVLGAIDSTASGNYFQATPGYYTVVNVADGNPKATTAMHSSNITIVNNVISRATQQYAQMTGTGAVKFADNIVGTSLAALVSPLLPAIKPLTRNTPTELTPFASVSVSTVFGGAAADLGYASVSTTGVGDAEANWLKDYLPKLEGGAGNDIYSIWTSADRIVEAAGGGSDTVVGDGRFFRIGDNVENLLLHSGADAVLLGNGLDNLIAGNAGADVLVGNGGSDTMAGGAGNDRFVVTAGAGATTITDFAKGDTVSIQGDPFARFADLQAALTRRNGNAVLDLGDGRSVTLKGIDPATLTAADFDFAEGGAATVGSFGKTSVFVDKVTHIALGGAGSQILYGDGHSVLAGGSGNDSYVLKGAGDHIVESAGGGIDTVLLNLSSYTLADNVENVSIRAAGGAAVVGNHLANVIAGGVGNDVITGGAGADLLSGGAGADRFVYRSAGEGGDTIRDFVHGIDGFDLSALRTTYPGAEASFVDTKAGQELHVTIGGSDQVLATLSNVHNATTADVFFG